jgi:hypothetical protein
VDRGDLSPENAEFSKPGDYCGFNRRSPAFQNVLNRAFQDHVYHIPYLLCTIEQFNGGIRMLKRFTWCAVAILFGALLIMLPVSGSISTVPQGGTAFIGEQGLDINLTGATTNTMIGWFGTVSNVTTSAPSATTSVDNAKNFYVAPSIFVGRTGPWYTLPDKKLAFYVEEPNINLRIYDQTSHFEVTGTTTWVPKGDQVGFTIETNLIPITNRPGVTMMPVTIHVRTPNGNELAAVSNYPLIDIPISTSPFSTGPVWDTSTYASGTYTVWAVCNVNSMKDNYPVDGKTMTPQAGNVQILSSNPLITSSVSPTQTSVFSTTRPATVATTEVTTAATSVVVTTSPPTTAPTTAPASLPPATTKAPGPDIVLIVGVLGLAAIIMYGKDST